MSDLGDLAPDYMAIKAKHTGENGGARPQQQRGEIALIRFADMQPRIEDRTIVGGLLNEREISMMVGASGTAKTFLALDMALRVSAGTPWFGQSTRKTGVAYIAAEAGEGIINRVCAIKTYYRDMPADLPFAAITSPVNLRDPAAEIWPVIDAIKAAELGLPVGLVIVDTLARAMAGGDENSSEDMGSFISNMDDLRAATGAHILILHHLGKDPRKGARGHSSLVAAVDTEIEITRDDATGISTAIVTKQRELPIATQKLSYRLRQVELGRDQNGQAVTSCIVEDAGPGPASQKPLGKLTGAALVGFQQLKNCLAAQSEEIPASEHVPAGIRGVTLTYWREYLEKAGVINAEGNPREQFRRIRVTLQERGYIGVWDDFVWLSHAVT